MEKETKEKIKEIRKSKGITQNEMAEKLAITQAGYQAIESGKVPLTIDRLAQIAEVFGMDLIDIFGYPDFNKDLEEVLISSKEVAEKMKGIQDDFKYLRELSDERKARIIFLEKLTSKIADCLEFGYSILSKNEVKEKQSLAIQKDIQDFVKQYDRLEEQIKMIEKED